ncbi:MAG: hypothetical protein RXS42_01250 [Nitrososphaeria archaeon]
MKRYFLLRAIILSAVAGSISAPRSSLPRPCAETRVIMARMPLPATCLRYSSWSTPQRGARGSRPLSRASPPKTPLCHLLTTAPAAA